MFVRQIVKNILLFFAFVFFVGTIIWGLQWFSNSLSGFFEKKVALTTQNFLSSLETSLANQQQISSNLLPTRNWEIDDLKISAESAICVQTDLKTKTKVLFKKDESKLLPTNGLSKLMTALVVLENYNLDQQVVISKDGQITTVRDLLNIMLTESSDSAENSLFEVLGQDNFVFLIQAKAKELGITNVDFSSLSAKDVVLLTENLLKYPLFLEIWNKIDNTKNAKTYSLVIKKSKQEGNYIIYVVLSAKDTVEEVEKIINWINTAYKW